MVTPLHIKDITLHHKHYQLQSILLGVIMECYLSVECILQFIPNCYLL